MQSADREFSETILVIRGQIAADDEVYHVEPMDGRLDGRHRVYRQSDSLLPVGDCGASCMQSQCLIINSSMLSTTKLASHLRTLSSVPQ